MALFEEWALFSSTPELIVHGQRYCFFVRTASAGTQMNVLQLCFWLGDIALRRSGTRSCGLT